MSALGTRPALSLERMRQLLKAIRGYILLYHRPPEPFEVGATVEELEAMERASAGFTDGSRYRLIYPWHWRRP